MPYTVAPPLPYAHGWATLLIKHFEKSMQRVFGVHSWAKAAAGNAKNASTPSGGRKTDKWFIGCTISIQP